MSWFFLARNSLETSVHGSCGSPSRSFTRCLLPGAELQLNQSGKHLGSGHCADPGEGVLDAFDPVKGLLQHAPIGIADRFHGLAAPPRVHELEGSCQQASEVAVELGCSLFEEPADAVALQLPVEALRDREADEILRWLEEGELEVLEVIREGWGFILLHLSLGGRWQGINSPRLATGIWSHWKGLGSGFAGHLTAQPTQAQMALDAPLCETRDDIKHPTNLNVQQCSLVRSLQCSLHRTHGCPCARVIACSRVRVIAHPHASPSF